MTYPEYLDLLLAFLAQTPRVVAIIGVVLSIVVVMLVTLAVAGEDIRRRDIYYEDYVRGNHENSHHP